MTDDPKQNSEILPPLTLAEEAVEMAKSAWTAATARYAAAHRAAIANLDQSSDIALRELVEPSEQQLAAGEKHHDLRASLHARMEDRVALLAEALQKHGLMRILDAAAAVDAIGRAAASASVPDPAKSPDFK